MFIRILCSMKVILHNVFSAFPVWLQSSTWNLIWSFPLVALYYWLGIVPQYFTYITASFVYFNDCCDMNLVSTKFTCLKLIAVVRGSGVGVFVRSLGMSGFMKGCQSIALPFLRWTSLGFHLLVSFYWTP